MLESIMLIALGFLIATLFALIATQFVWRRAVKITTRKLTADLDLDELKASADQANSLSVSLRDRNNEVASLTRKNITLEENLAATRQEIATLNQNIAELQTEYAALKTEAETRLHELTALQTHVGEIESALRIDFEKRGIMENQLKALGSKTLQLLEEMNRAVMDFSDTKHIQTLFETTAEPTPAPEKPEVPVKLKPFVFEEAEAFNGEEEAASSNTSEAYIADRIRALEAGVNAPA